MRQFRSVSPLLLLFVAGCSSDLGNATEADIAAVRQAVATILEVKPEAIPIDVPFSKLRPPADELDFVEIVMELEDKLSLNIPNSAVGIREDTPGFPGHMTVVDLARIVGTIRGEDTTKD